MLTEYRTLKRLHRLPADPLLTLFERYCDRAAPAFGAMEWSWKIMPDAVLANRIYWLGASDERAVTAKAITWLLSVLGTAPSAVGDFDRVLVAYAGPNPVTARGAVIKIYWTLNRADRPAYDRLVRPEWPALPNAPIDHGTILHSRTIELDGSSKERVYFMFDRDDYRRRSIASFFRTVAGAEALKVARMYPRSGLCLKRDGTDMLGIGLRPTGRRRMDPEFLMTPVMIPLVHAAVRLPHLEERLNRVTWVTVPLDEVSLPRCPREMNVYVHLHS